MHCNTYLSDEGSLSENRGLAANLVGGEQDGGGVGALVVFVLRGQSSEQSALAD
jgi:hypothetical protein